MTQQHGLIQTNGIRIHTVEEGEGPLVLLVHGFPESWYSWRHQLQALAEAGYRAVAIDVRGYGRSSKPTAVEDYRMLELVADVVGLVAGLGEETATLVGHDWGAPIVWNSALLRPDLFRGVAGLSVPYHARSSVRPTDGFRRMSGDDEFYILYFQEPGRAEAEIEKDVRQWLLGFYFTASGEDRPSDKPAMAAVSPGGELRDRFHLPEKMLDWLTEADLDFYAGEFERSGFTGGLNRYRNVDRDWQDLAAFHERPIEIPALFIGGDRDGPTMWGGASIDRFSQTLPKLHQSIILEHCGHWIQQERPQETNAALIEFLGAIHTP